MPRISQWEDHIGRRLRLRDLFVFFTVVERGSMSKAAAQLGVSTPSISALITALEQTLGVRLLDRTAKGVLPTHYGRALLSRAHAAFDELRQGLRDIEFISDPAAGEVRIGCSELLMPFLVRVIEYISRQHPRLHFHVQEARWPTVEFPELLERKIDLTFARLASFPRPGRLHDELQAEVLFDDPFCAVVGLHSKWAHRRRLDLAELSNERWLSTPPDVLAGRFVTEAFEASGLQPPRPAVATSSTYVRGTLASRGDYIAVVPRSMLILDKQRHALRRLPITLSAKPSPVAIVTLKNRSLTPTVLKFIETARQIANFYFNKRKGRGRLSPT